MSDDKFITVPVRVPADLEVVRESPTLHWIRCPSDGKYAKCLYHPNDPHWVHDVGRQIAAAVEARKPKPPLFQVGDVVEWEHHGQPRAGIVTSTSVVANERLYGVNDGIDCLRDHALKLVRRAAT